MKKLLSVAVLLALVAALMPGHAYAAFRGVWDPLTNGSAFNTGLANGCEQPALRNANNRSNGGSAIQERWYCFTTRSTVVGHETVRSIWMGQNSAQIGTAVVDINDARTVLLIDPSANVSYIDPAWDKNGDYLAYVQTDGNLTTGALYVQKYAKGTTMAAATVPLGAPILVVPAAPGVTPRNPSFNEAGTAIAYASNAAGPSLDIWTVSVDLAAGTAGAPVRVTNVDTKAETQPDWGPGNRIAYATNKFGRNVVEILDMDDMSTTLAETNFAAVSHNNPSWAPNGNEIYYDAPQNEDNANNGDIWRINITTQAKCDLFFDNRGDADPDVSVNTNFNLDGLPYNNLLISTQGGNFGLGIWRGNGNSCLPSLPIGIAISPTTLNLGSQGGGLTVEINMPAETQSHGFRAVCDADKDGNPGAIPAGTEGVKNRNTTIPSPLVLGLAVPSQSPDFSPFGNIKNITVQGEQRIQAFMDRKTIAARLTALGLVNTQIIVPVTCYSTPKGRQFQGYGVLGVTSNNNAGQVVKLEQNSPNPFNPSTKIRFAVAKPGFVNVRIYNVRGELVKTVASGNYQMGMHEASWDGSTRTGAKAATGVYFAKASVSDGKGGEITSDVVKMVMAK